MQYYYGRQYWDWCWARGGGYLRRGIVSVPCIVDPSGQNAPPGGARLSGVLSPTPVGIGTPTLDSHDKHHTSTATAQQLNMLTTATARPPPPPPPTFIAIFHGHSHFTDTTTNSPCHAHFHGTCTSTVFRVGCSTSPRCDGEIQPRFRKSSRSAEVPGQVGSAGVHAHFNPSELSAHQISPVGVTPHLSLPCAGSEVRTAELDGRPTLWRRPPRVTQLARHAKRQARQSSTRLSSCTRCLSNPATKRKNRDDRGGPADTGSDSTSS